MELKSATAALAGLRTLSVTLRVLNLVLRVEFELGLPIFKVHIHRILSSPDGLQL